MSGYVWRVDFVNHETGQEVQIDCSGPSVAAGHVTDFYDNYGPFRVSEHKNVSISIYTTTKADPPKGEG